MLDVIADFWKPAKKGQAQEKLQPEQLQIGSSLGFGFVPQTLLSGRRLQVSGINTYQFGDETLTSFVLTQEKDAGVSMIVAESEGEHYLAISRRIALNDRMKLFDSQELEDVTTKNDAVRLACSENLSDFKGWIVASYKREIQGLKGRIYKGDFRKAPLPATNEGHDFEYTLLVSDSNEHAIEVEKYTDGRIEVYATVYRRMNDVGEITHPGSNELTRPDIKLASSSESSFTKENAPVISSPKLPEANMQSTDKSKSPSPAISAIRPTESPSSSETAIKQASNKPSQEDKTSMAIMETAINGTRTNMNNTSPESNQKPKLYVQPNAPETYLKQEVKAVTNGALNSNLDSEAIECDLRVANKIIDEAIRNEMRLTDIVRRIIELPVAYPESVQIPITLTDEDYALLAIRYSISSSDRNAIKRRILEDLNDFSGGTKKVA